MGPPYGWLTVPSLEKSVFDLLSPLRSFDFLVWALIAPALDDIFLALTHFLTILFSIATSLEIYYIYAATCLLATATAKTGFRSNVRLFITDAGADISGFCDGRQLTLLLPSGDKKKSI